MMCGDQVKSIYRTLLMQQAITEAKDKLIEFVDNEEDTYPVKFKIDSTIAALTKNAKSYGVGLIID